MLSQIKMSKFFSYCAVCLIILWVHDAVLGDGVGAELVFLQNAVLVLQLNLELVVKATVPFTIAIMMDAIATQFIAWLKRDRAQEFVEKFKQIEGEYQEEEAPQIHWHVDSDGFIKYTTT